MKKGPREEREVLEKCPVFGVRDPVVVLQRIDLAMLVEVQQIGVEPHGGHVRRDLQHREHLRIQAEVIPQLGAKLLQAHEVVLAAGERHEGGSQGFGGSGGAGLHLAQGEGAVRVLQAQDQALELPERGLQHDPGFLPPGQEPKGCP